MTKNRTTSEASVSALKRHWVVYLIPGTQDALRVSSERGESEDDCALVAGRVRGQRIWRDEQRGYLVKYL
jgi:hypothetical protein